MHRMYYHRFSGLRRLLHHQLFFCSLHFSLSSHHHLPDPSLFFFPFPFISDQLFLHTVHHHWICLGQDPIVCCRTAIVSIFSSSSPPSLSLLFSSPFSRFVLYVSSHYQQVLYMASSPL
ncbi:hypothetical protein DFH29DRAFT_373098 [Suillus ampliporus]|nr:hypothetical protein DFH29DRAFT_373098 [Suillus ampliporus]